MSAPLESPHRRRLAWIAWLIAAAVAAVGLKHYRVDNSVDAWAPELGSDGPYASYLVVGWPNAGFEPGEIAQHLRTLPEIEEVLDETTVQFLRPLLHATPDRFVRSTNGDYSGLFAFPRRGVDDADLLQRAHQALQARFGRRAESIAVGGPTAYHVAINHFSQHNMPWIMGGITVMGLLVMRLFTRSWRVALAAIAAVTLTQIMLLGIIAWHDRPIDMSISMVPPLMMAMGYSYSVHRALRPQSGRALLWCGITTALGIGSFATSPLPPVRSFALYGAFGVVLVWSATAMLVPPAPAQVRSPLVHHAIRATLRLRRAPAALMTAAAVVTIAGLLAIPKLNTAADPISYFPATAPVRQDFEWLDRHLTGMLPFQLISDRPIDIERLELSETVTKAINISPLIAAQGTTLWCLAPNRALPRLMEAWPRWQAIAGEQGATLRWRGVAAQLAAAHSSLLGSAGGSILLMLAIAPVAMWAVTRQVRSALLAAWISALPVAALVVIAWWAGRSVELPSLMIGAIAIGMAVDDTLHLGQSARVRGSTRRAIIECWPASVGSSLATASSLALFALSPFRPISQFGLLLSAATLLALAANLLLFSTGRTRR